MNPLKSSVTDLAGLPFPRALQAIRRAAGLTQQEVADALQVSQPYVSEIETGRRLLPTEARVSEVARVIGLGAAESRKLIALWNRHRSAPEVAHLVTHPRIPRDARDARELLEPLPGPDRITGPARIPESFPLPGPADRTGLLRSRKLEAQRTRELLAEKARLAGQIQAAQAEINAIDAELEAIWKDRADDAERPCGADGD